MNRNRWLILFIVSGCVFAAVATVGLIIIINDQSRISRISRAQDAATRESAANLACVTKWANATSARSAYLQRYLRPRNDAQNALSLAIVNNAPQSVQDRLRKTLIAASAAYDRAQAKAPLPPPPLLNCDPKPDASVPTDRPSATSSLPSSRASTSTTRRPAPAAASSTPRATTPTAPRRVSTSTSPTKPPTRTRTVTRPAPSTTAPAPARTSGLVNGVLCPIVNLSLICPTETP